jgi:hypothetical protein
LLIALVLGILVLVVPTIGLGYGYINSSVSSAINSAIGGGNGGGGGGGGGTPSPTPAPPVTYRAAVLATYPVGYWRLGETSGTTAVDEMGTYNGTYVGFPTLGATGLLTGDSNTAVTLTAGQHLTVPVASNFSGTTSWTFAAWIDVDPTYLSYSRVFEIDDGSGGNLECWIDAATLAINRQNSAGAENNYMVVMAAGVHQIVVTFDGSYVTTWLDARLPSGIWGTTNPLPSSRSLPSMPNPVFVGSNPSGGQTLLGTIDESAIWNRALTADEIAGLYAAGS